MKTREQAKAEFVERGESMASWARKKGFDTVNTRRVLNGEVEGRYGESHRIAVALGIKNGTVVANRR